MDRIGRSRIAKRGASARPRVPDLARCGLRGGIPALLASTLLLGACASGPSSVEQLSATWRGARVYMPAAEAGKTTPVYLGNAADWASAIAKDGVTPKEKIPAVIHLHGCQGFNRSDPRLGVFYARNGFAVFGPNSFAREHRRVLCDLGHQMPYRMAMRLEEAHYALEQLKSIAWIDQGRVVLSGFSEGGQAASSYSGVQFAGVVLLGTDCRFVGGQARSPEAVPVLNIVGSADHYGYGGGCLPHPGPRSRNLVVRGAPHDVSLEDEALAELARFLAAIRR